MDRKHHKRWGSLLLTALMVVLMLPPSAVDALAELVHTSDA